MRTQNTSTWPLLNKERIQQLPGIESDLQMLDYPVKVLQIGEGNFLRGFFDWMIYECNRKGLFHGSIAVSQPRPGGRHKLEQLRQQDGIYGLMTRGLQDGEKIELQQWIPVFSKMVEPYSEWAAFLKLAENPDLDIIVSNTTEAGLDYQPSEWNPNEPVLSFPGKLTLLLYRRYECFSGSPDKGWMILPCELLERNGDILKSIVLRHAQDWNLPSSFRRWVTEHNVFLNSLVDRIVTGYPEKAEEFFGEWGLEDRLLNTAELITSGRLKGMHAWMPDCRCKQQVFKCSGFLISRPINCGRYESLMERIR